MQTPLSSWNISAVYLSTVLCKCPSNEPIKSCGQFRLQYTETGSKCTKGRWDIWEGVSSFWTHHRQVKRQHCMQPRILQKARKEKEKKKINHPYFWIQEKLFSYYSTLYTFNSHLYECRDNFKAPNDQKKWSYYNEREQRIANNSKNLPIRHLLKTFKKSGHPFQFIKIICYLTLHKI